jgi:hypothetical protein
MNCFNVRELQILLRGRFFADLVNDTAHHNFLNNTMIGLRFKTNDLNTINPNTLLTYQFGLSNTPFTQQTPFNSNQQGTVREGAYNFLPFRSVKHTTVSLFTGSDQTKVCDTHNNLNLFETGLFEVVFSFWKLVKNTALY